MVRDVKAGTGITSEEIAERLDWSVRSVTHALSESETLLAKNAYELFHAIHPGAAFTRAQIEADANLTSVLRAWHRLRDHQLKTLGWMARYEFSQLRPAAFIPRHEIPQLADLLAAAIAKSPKARQRLKERISNTLNANAEVMANQWRSSLLGWVLSLVVRGSTRVSLKGSPSEIIGEVMSLLVNTAFPKKKEAK